MNRHSEDKKEIRKTKCQGEQKHPVEGLNANALPFVAVPSARDPVLLLLCVVNGVLSVAGGSRGFPHSSAGSAAAPSSWAFGKRGYLCFPGATMEVDKGMGVSVGSINQSCRTGLECLFLAILLLLSSLTWAVLSALGQLIL